MIAYRIDLTPEQTAVFDERALMEKRRPVTVTARQWRGLRSRHRRYIRHEFLKKLKLTKRHKPKPLGGHHSVTLRIYREINGYDEEYHTWGTEDDDFGRRVYEAGGKAAIAVRDILVFHQHHPSRAPTDWHKRHNAELFKQKRPTRCEWGLDSPAPQGEVEVVRITPGRRTQGR